MVYIGKVDAINQLQVYISQIPELVNLNTSSVKFKKWKKDIEISLKYIFGEKSSYIKDFTSISFHPGVILATDNSYIERDAFSDGIKSVQALLEALLDEVKKYWTDDNLTNDENQIKPIPKKIFISHSTLDKDYVKCLIDLFEGIGLTEKEIFCSSFIPYGIELGEDFLVRLRKELDENVIVIFLITNNFYKSPICLCEMGATWVKTNLHFPIVVPPLEFENIKGVITQTQGLKITDIEKINSLYSLFKKTFKLKEIDISSWERKRTKFLEEVNLLINNKISLDNKLKKNSNIELKPINIVSEIRNINDERIAKTVYCDFIIYIDEAIRMVKTPNSLPKMISYNINNSQNIFNLTEKLSLNDIGYINKLYGLIEKTASTIEKVNYFKDAHFGNVEECYNLILHEVFKDKYSYVLGFEYNLITQDFWKTQLSKEYKTLFLKLISIGNIDEFIC